ncbi:hypothetical protein EC973_001141 [Apophysomyces ossiformis]|uniref:Nucleotide-diphospho-sugar transferase domain-containing protein n=1 Tax=Apophysomyces ossiformis TaxID=679940 RepID=A0A8H7BPJ2_9FUNG|nr:hypothetical protein EC973_001141 [Apophysomyces ossiformis]
METLLRKRTVIVIVCLFFLLSLFAFTSSLFPSRVANVSEDLTTFTDGQPLDSTTTSLASDEAEDQPEEEDLIQVHTELSDAKSWKPKTFEPVSDTITNIVKANVRKHKKDQVLLTAVANNGMASYTLNWIESLHRCKLADKFLVFAIDKELVDTLTEKGYGDHVVLIPENWFHQKLSAGFAEWLDKDYTPITHSKSLVVERLLYMGITVWFSDVDIVFTSPAIYDYLMTKLTSRKFTEVLFTQETEQKIVNSGFYVMRPSNINKRILDESIRIQDNEPKVTQQRAINRILDEMNLNYQTSPIALLDLALFPHGRMYFERKIPTKYGMEPMMVHANYRKGDAKRISLIDANLWYID